MSNNTIKLLIYGSGNVSPINIVLENLRKYSKNKYDIKGLNLYTDDKVTTQYKFFDDVDTIKIKKYHSISSVLKKRIFALILKKEANQIALLKFIIRFRIKDALRSIRHKIELEYNKTIYKNYFKNFDIVNLQCVTEERANLVCYAPDHCKIILSFWGSDLMAFSGVSNYASILRAVDRADIITLSSIELREIFLSKFGRQYKNKIRFTAYGQNDDIFNFNGEDIKKLKSVGVELLMSNGIEISHFDYLIKVGYSGYESQNHLTIIENCSMLPENLKSKILLVIPMTYGASSEYIKRVEACAQENGITACILKEYLTKEEALSVSYICDIMLNLRENDAFNNAMMETLMAEKILVSGGWLPYSTLRNNKIFFHEISDFKEIPDQLSYIFENIAHELEQAKLNPEKLKKFLPGWVNGPIWDKIFEEALGI